jgi:hypothetical protein
MFHLVLTTCFAGILCYGSQPDMGYVSAERCLQQGVIISGLARANLGHSQMEQTSRIVCSDADGAATVVVLGREDAMLDFPADVSSLPAIE